MKIRHIASKLTIVTFIIGSLVGLYALLGFYGLPALVAAKLPTLIQQQTGRKASVAAVRFDPFSFQLSVQKFELKEPGGQPFASFDEFFIDIDAQKSIDQAALVIDQARLHKPFAHIARNKDGTFNVKDLFKEDAKPKPADATLFPVNIAKLSISEGRLDWDDAHLPNPEQETLYPINLALEQLTTRADSQTKFGLNLNLNSGGSLAWQGVIGLSPLVSSGHIKLDNVSLPRIRALVLQDALPLAVQGYERLEADYTLDYADNNFNLDVNRGQFELRDVQLAASSQEPALAKIAGFSVNGIGFNLAKHELNIDSVSAQDADFKAWLSPEGVFNYQTLMPTATAQALPVEPPTTPWAIKIDTIALDNFGLSFEDRTLTKPLTVVAKPMSLKLSKFTNTAGASLPFQLSASLNQTGLINLDGKVVAEPLSAQIALAAKDIALENFQTYVDKFARLDVIDGTLAVDGKVLIAKSAQDTLAVKFAGNTKIADLLTRDQLKNKDFVSWEALTLNGIDADFPANRYSAETLVLAKPYARIVIKKDKTVNFGDIMIADQTARDTSTPKTPKPSFKLGSIQVINGASDFTDLSLILPFAAQIKSLDGGASGISSEQKSTIKANLKGTAYDLAPVDVKGEISPYLGDYTMTVNFTGMPMPLISSYMVQFAGYKVEKGKMSLELEYKVANRELTASNNILIDRFELGEKVENPDAVSLPLELAVALMKDGDGKIKIHVPISGSLEDPQFSISHIVSDALVNAISKVIASPFRALASLIGSERDLSTISFAAGAAKLTPPQIDKLNDLTKALSVRSDLNLEIKGAAFQEQDWPAVSDDALYDQLKRIKAAEINKQGGRKIRAEHVVISDQDYRRLMEQLFVEKFPLMLEKTLQGTLRLVGSKADTDTDEFYAVAKQQLSAIIQPEEQRLKGLAAERAQAIANYIVQKGGIANERVFILDTAINPARQGNGIVSLLSLQAD